MGGNHSKLDIEEKNKQRGFGFRPENNTQYEYLVLSGGGVKCVAEAGAVLELERRGILQNMKGFAGTSGGSILAALLACKYTAREIIDMLMQLDYKQMLDVAWEPAECIERLLKGFGICTGNFLLNFMQEKIGAKTGDENITLAELYKVTGLELVITVSCVNEQIPYYLSHQTAPDCPVALAVRMSSSIPYVFESVEWKGRRWVDGGMLDNDPITCFNSAQPGLHNRRLKLNPKVLNLKLVEPEYATYRDDMMVHIHKIVRDLLHFSLQLLLCMMSFNETLTTTEIAGYWDQSILIKPSGVTALSVGIGQDIKKRLIHEGITEVTNFFDSRSSESRRQRFLSYKRQYGNSCTNKL